MSSFSLHSSIGHMLNMAANAIRRELNDEFQRAGFPVMAEHWALLVRLGEHPGINQQELAERLSRDNASVTRSLAILLRKQLIRREQSTQDRRNRHLWLTDEGQRLLPLLVQCAERGLVRATKGISAREVALLNEVLHQVVRNLKE